jgi:hypothetical protein
MEYLQVGVWVLFIGFLAKNKNQGVGCTLIFV